MGLRPLYFLSMKKVILLFLIIFPLFAHGQISISNLNEATTINSSDLFLLTQGSSSKKLKYNTLQTKILSTVIPWSDTLINGKMVSKYHLYNQLLPKINWIDTIAPNGKLLKFVENHDGTGTFDSSKLVTKYDLASSNLQITANTVTAGVTSGVAIEGGSYDGVALYGLSQIGMPLYIKHANGNTNYFIRADNYLNSPKFTVNYNGDITTTGLLTYKFCHAVGSADSINYTPTVTQNLYTKINTGSFVIHDTLGITIRGDSLKVQYAGDYKVTCWMSATTSNANDKLRVRLYSNNIPNTTSIGRWIINSNGTGNGQSENFMWYKKSVTANTWFSVRITNLTASRNPNITDFKIYIEKVPE